MYHSFLKRTGGQKRLPPSGAMPTRKKRKIEQAEGPTASSSHSTETSFARGQEPVSVVPRAKATPQADRKNGESLNELRSMVMRDLDLSESQKQYVQSFLNQHHLP